MPEAIEMVKLSAPERSRTYVFAIKGGGFVNVNLMNVVAVCVRPSGTHRLETANGRKHIVPPGWLRIELDVDEWTF